MYLIVKEFIPVLNMLNLTKTRPMVFLLLSVPLSSEFYPGNRYNNMITFVFQYICLMYKTDVTYPSSKPCVAV